MASNRRNSVSIAAPLASEKAVAISKAKLPRTPQSQYVAGSDTWPCHKRLTPFRSSPEVSPVGSPVSAAASSDSGSLHQTGFPATFELGQDDSQAIVGVVLEPQRCCNELLVAFSAPAFCWCQRTLQRGYRVSCKCRPNGQRSTAADHGLRRRPSGATRERPRFVFGGEGYYDRCGQGDAPPR